MRLATPLPAQYLLRAQAPKSPLPTPVSGKWASAQVPAALDALVNSDVPDTTRILVRTWNAAKDDPSFGEIQRAIEAGTLTRGDVEEWQAKYNARLEGELLAKQQNAARIGAAATATAVAAGTGQHIYYGHVSKVLDAYVQQHTAALVVDIGEQQRNALKFLVQRYVVESPINPRELGKIVRASIGLTDVQTSNLARFRDTLSRAGSDPASIDRQVSLYSDRMLRMRAERIARTETAFAFNEAGFTIVREARDAGAFTGELRKRWSTAGDEMVCKMCSAMDGKSVGFDENFDLPFGGLVVRVPPGHPWCRCTVIYFEA